MRKYELTEFLKKRNITETHYNRWLDRKAASHVRRDRGRGNTEATIEKYKIAIHNAVIESNGKDVYTGEELEWQLLSKYDNTESKKKGKPYKKKFALLPSVDHVGDGNGEADFKICSWRTNDAKNDLSYEEFLELCKKVVKTATE